MGPKPGTRIIRLTDTIQIQTDAQFEGEVFNDLGRYEVTGKAADRWRYLTPTLRNVALTAPYMHDGSLSDLEAVIGFYMQGGFEDPDKDPRIRPFDLSDAEVGDLKRFLESLTSPHVAGLISDARQAGVGDF